VELPKDLHGEMVRILIPLLLLALIHAQTYYLSYGVVVESEKGWWNPTVGQFFPSQIPNGVEAYRIEVRPLLNNTTVTLFIPLKGSGAVLSGEGEVVEWKGSQYLRVHVQRPLELVVETEEVATPLVYEGILELPPEEKEENVTVEVVEEREAPKQEVETEVASEEEREEVKEVLQVKKDRQGLNLPPLGDIFLIIIIAGVLIALSLVMRHYKPKEREGREPINPYTYEVEFKKPPKA